MGEKWKRVAGLIFAAAFVFVLLSGISYLVHWQEDMSLLNGGQADAQAGNICGMFGLKTGWMFIAELFGLGSFALLAIIACIALKLLIDDCRIPFFKTSGIALGASVLLSLILAYIGNVTGNINQFGGGLGGKCGAYVIGGLITSVKPVITALILLILTICFLFLCSDRFSRWFAGLFKGMSLDIEAPEAVRKERRSRESKSEPESRSEQEPELGPEPEPELDPEPKMEFFTGLQSTDVPTEKREKPQSPAPKPSAPKSVVSKKEEPKTEEAEGNFEVLKEGEELTTEVVKELEPIDNRMDTGHGGLPRYKFPTLSLLDDYNSSAQKVSTEELMRNNNKIRATLANYKIQITDVKALVGPTVTLYKVTLAPGVKIAAVKKLQEDIAMSMGAKGVRVVTLEDSVGIEVANDHQSTVPLKALLNSDAFHNTKADLPVAIGYTIKREVKVFDLADAPHLLVAGATKQGKSVGLNIIVSSLLYYRHPSELKFVFIDPKMVEFSSYGNLLHHYLAVLPDAEDEQQEKNNAIVKNPKNAEKVLRSLCIEMDERYELLSNAGVNNIRLYNDKFKKRKLNPQDGHKYLPYLVTVVDEYADLTMMTGASPEARAASRSITNSIIRLAQKGRAAGIHVILATQRPSVDVISGVIKSNFPMRIAFRVASRIDSQTILDNPGAEKLIGKGDMLFSAGIDSERIQCGFVSGDEVDRITEFIGDQTGYGKSYSTPYYLPVPAEATGEAGGASIDMTDVDERFAEAANMVVTTQRGSTSDLQRKLGMGYAKAGRVMDQLEAAGIVGPQQGSKPRQVLIGSLDELEPILRAYKK